MIRLNDCAPVTEEVLSSTPTAEPAGRIVEETSGAVEEAEALHVASLDLLKYAANLFV